MASTNKTTHYELSQYVGTDKPTYLTDYNQDMSRIDAGIYGAKALADVNETAIGDLTDLTTTAKTNLVGAINEVDADVLTNTNNISTNTANISTNTTNIGTLSNLTTSSKNNLVVAINEVDANCDSNATHIGDLTDLDTSAKSNLVASINEVNYNVGQFNLSHFYQLTTSDITSERGATIGSCNIEYATNDDGSLAKIYGKIELIPRGNDTLSFQTTLRPSTDININGHVTRVISGSNQYGINNIYNWNYVTMTIHTDGTVSVPSTYVWNSGGDSAQFFFTNSLLFIKDFGDTPIPEPPTPTP